MFCHLSTYDLNFNNLNLNLNSVSADEDWTSKTPVHHCKLGCCLNRTESGTGLSALDDECFSFLQRLCGNPDFLGLSQV